MTQAPAPLTREHISYSQANSLRTCGWAYKLERVDRKPQRPSAAAVAGRVIHTASEKIDAELHDPWGDHLELGLIEKASEVAADALRVEIEKNSSDYPPDQWKKYGSQDINWFATTGIPRAITAYVEWRKLTRYTLLELPGFGPAIEVPFDLTLDGQIVRGFIDRIFLDEHGTPLIVDLKSGSKPKTDEQLGTYNRALATAGLGRDFKWGAYLYGLKTGTATLTTPVDLTYYDDERLRVIYGQADMMIRLGIFLPNPGQQCFFCSVTEHCDFFRSAI